MLTKVLVGVAIAVVVLLVAVSTRPSTFRVVRSLRVAAPPAAVYAQVADFHRWEAWSPWAHLDPAMKQTYGGAPSGAGAVYEWDGNDKAGAGRMTITDARPAERVDIKLEFIRPFPSTNSIVFTFTPGGEVTWAMEGRHTFMTKAFSLVKSMDALVGPDFEKGLASLRSVAEKPAATAAAR